MLIQFTLSNVLSYRDERCFSLLASQERGHEGNLISAEQSGYEKLNKVALLYGANASGKSNLLKALAFLQFFVATGHTIQQGQPLLRSPFKLDSAKVTEPTSFEVIFVEGGVRYAYGISLTENAVVSEYLYYWPEGRKATVFERNSQDFRFTKRTEEQRALAGRTQPAAPYLSVATNWNFDLTAPAFRWLTQRLVVSVGNPLNPVQGYLNPAWRNYTASRLPSALSEILALLHAADFGISNLSSESRPPREAEIPTFLTQEMREIIKAAPVWDIVTFHLGRDSEGNATQVPFALPEESLGTQRFFELLGPWLDVLNSEKVFFMDEFDTGFHPLLAEHLLSHFLKKAVRSQFVFTTHNTNLLSSGFLRRDQIWITEIEPETRGTSLYALSDLAIRNDHNLEKGYLAGKYGGIPLPGARG